MQWLVNRRHFQNLLRKQHQQQQEELSARYGPDLGAYDTANPYDYYNKDSEDISEQNFFLKVSFHRPHSPYDPPVEWWDKYKDVQMPSRPLGKWSQIYNISYPLNSTLSQPPCDGGYDCWCGNMGDEVVNNSRRG